LKNLFVPWDCRIVSSLLCQIGSNAEGLSLYEQQRDFAEFYVN
jgi:hypothetical protein